MKRKLKKLEQILAEFSCYHVDQRGIIRHPLWGHQLTPDMITCLGREIEIGEDGRASSGYGFDESWFEQPVKKKLYAYKSKIVFQDAKRSIRSWEELDTITFNEIENDKYGTRVPEFDIEYHNEGAG